MLEAIHETFVPVMTYSGLDVLYALGVGLVAGIIFATLFFVAVHR